MTCVAIGDKKATMSFHLAIGDESVDVVEATEATVGSFVETTAILTISGATNANAVEYYCKATWDSESVKSANVYLAVLGLEATEMSTAAAEGQIGKFYCKSDAYLHMNANGDAYKDADDKKVYPDVVVSWESSTDNGANWAAVSGDT